MNDPVNYQYGVRSRRGEAIWRPKRYFDTIEEAQAALEKLRGSYKTRDRRFEIIVRKDRPHGNKLPLTTG